VHGAEVGRGLVLVGLNHRTAPVEVREQVAFANGRLEGALRRLVELHGVTEGAILSTCNRVEVIACGSAPDTVGGVLPSFLAAEHGVTESLLSGHVYTLVGREAVRHLFRVAASLDSMVVGEPQILGQLKEQYAAAAAAGASGRILHRCFHRSFSVAKRVRTETGIAEKAVSVGSAAVELASGIVDRLDDKTALLLGAGTMGELTARQLLAHGVGSLLVANRTFDRGIEMARALGGIPVPWERVAKSVTMADLVIAAASSGEQYLLRRAVVDEAMAERRQRPMILIDLAVPRALEPSLGELDGVYLYDIDDLEGVMADNRGAREREAARAEAIVDAEVDAFWRWFSTLDAVPTIVALRDKLEGIRRRELARWLGPLGDLDPRQRAAVERMTSAIVNKILHAPVTALRRHQADPSEAFYVEAARRLFHLDRPDPGEGGEDDEDS
jgi:glutamyl-tRNA reductase